MMSRDANSFVRWRRWCCSSMRRTSSPEDRFRVRSCCSSTKSNPQWRQRIPAAVHVDGTARIQTVEPRTQPRLGATLEAFHRRTGLPVVINTSLNTAGRPMVDDPRDALELFGSAPVDLLVMGPHLVRRAGLFSAGAR